MGKSCCAVLDTQKDADYCFTDFQKILRRREWIAAVNRKKWEPTEYSWICNYHFFGGQKLNDPTSPAYSPTFFAHINSPKKRKAEEDLRRFSRFKETKRRRVETLERERMNAEESEKEAEERERLRYEDEQQRERLETE